MKIAHTADWHLRDSQYGRMDRGEDFTKAMFALVEEVSKIDCKHMVVSGDIFHTKKPSSKTIGEMMTLNQKLMQLDITAYFIAGNHDDCEPYWLSVLERESYESHGKSALQDVTGKVVEISDGTTQVTIYGAPSPDLHPDDFREQAPSWPKADILLYHGPVKEFAAFPMGDNALCMNDMPEQYRLIALGDIHTFKVLNKNDTIVTYPGPIEYCSGNEEPEKTCSIFDFHLTNQPALTRLRIPTRRVIQRTVETEEDMVELMKQLSKLQEPNPLVRVKYSSEVPNVLGRISSIIDPTQGIIKVEAKDKRPINQNESWSQDSEQERTPEDFVADFFDPNDPLFSLARSCCRPENKPSELITRYINNQLEKTNEYDESGTDGGLLA